jgi:dipeptidyl aminopeptidase/acylaminoacyl peptidase
MKQLFFAGLALCLGFSIQAQKKAIDHSVYDQWQSLGERLISSNGRYAAYTVNPQEGDGVLVVQSLDKQYQKTFPRGYNVVLTEDSRYAIFRIRPLFKETREARIKKKLPADMPKDSLGILLLGTDSIIKIARVKSFKTPEEGSGWVAYHLDKALPDMSKPVALDSITRIRNVNRMADSLQRMADSLRLKAQEASVQGLAVLQPAKKPVPPARPVEDFEEGTDLVVMDLQTGKRMRYPLSNDYAFSKGGQILIVETSKKKGDTTVMASLIRSDLKIGRTDTIFRKFNDAKNYSMDETGGQIAFVAERDSAAKALRKFYQLYYYRTSQDSAKLIADGTRGGVPAGKMISPDFTPVFSKDGQKLFLGLAPIRPVKDTSLVDFETARLDVWTYKDDYLQPQQLVQLNSELRRSYLAMWPTNGQQSILPIGNESLEAIQLGNEGNAAYAIGQSTQGYRIQTQWTQHGLSKLYLIDLRDGSKKMIADPVRGGARLSPMAQFVLWYDFKKRQYMSYEIATGKTQTISSAVKVPLFDEDDDHPDDPPPHGIMGWAANDRYVYVYDKFDIWQLDPRNLTPATCWTKGLGRKRNMTIRYQQTDREERFIQPGQEMIFEVFDQKNKGDQLLRWKEGTDFSLDQVNTLPQNITGVLKAKQSDAILFTRQEPSNVNLYAGNMRSLSEPATMQKLSDLNPQQAQYNWYTVEKHDWKMFDGKMSEGLLFKPENFDPSKKYPVIFYFYERNTDTRYNYRAPAPSASTINIAYFTSNGYLVFDPNIYYKTGQPGEDAYNSVVSAARYLAKMSFVDSTKMAIQGQSWGGYQVAYLVTRTNMFAAAGAGAPVANMTSAYGGIRWGAGITRQFQYEHSQSRIGATLWQRPDLYIKNSPLFKADKVNTPLLMMHNDKDGAVPWYQGIEYFTALKRLNKPVWLLQYNDEDHNLVERRNRKDLSVRLAQFFDHYLKGAPAPRWMTEGVPATLKGIDWGLQ